MRFRTALRSLLVVATLTSPLAADEGMWLLNHPPTAALKSSYGFEPTSAWLEHVQKSAVRFSTGGSGSIISKDGLVMTNHHVGSDVLAALSTAEHNLLDEGFRAVPREEEPRCPDLALDVLWSIEDVTARVQGAAKGAADDAAASAARLAAIAAIEAEAEAAASKGTKEATTGTAMKAEVVTLYQGGQYHLYRYRRYTDVRLVFAPEQAIAYFGGDADNFEYPRYNLDCCFFRIYENNKPLAAEHFLTWSDKGAAAEELVFVVGHPGRTQRLFTNAHLEFLRDVELPWALAKSWREEMKLAAFAGRSAENARVALEDAQGIANGRKARTGLIEGLQDPTVMAAKKSDEDRMRTAIAAKPELASLGAAWDRVAAAQAVHRTIYERRQLLEDGWRGPVLARIARQIVRLTEESTKPNAERLREYADARRDTIERSLFSPEPIHDALEIEWMAIRLGFLAERLGASDPLVVTLLDGKSPRARAEQVIRGTTLRDIAARKALVAGGADAVKASKDPMIAFMRALDPAARAVRQRYEQEVEAVERSAYADIAKAEFATQGDSTYPDATFTLRLAYGPVRGWTEAGSEVPPFTNYAGLYRRADERHGERDFALPKRWIDGCQALSKDVPFNFVCTADIIGGNSGSPVINRAGEVVGLIFDGNIQSLVGDVLYDGSVNRAVAVDARGMIEAFEKIYGAGELVREIRGGR
jgi:hypothetical protein